MTYNNHAILALLNEYENSIDNLVVLITNIDPNQLTILKDSNTDDLDCISIQTILTHICRSSYGYLNLILLHLDRPQIEVPKNLSFKDVKHYNLELKTIIDLNKKQLSTIKNNTIENKNSVEKIQTSWGQKYDIEQLMEHAIVHILRHRFQIEKFLSK